MISKTMCSVFKWYLVSIAVTIGQLTPTAAECDPVKEWMESRSSPQVKQLDSTRVLLDWSQLWTERSWEGGCVESATIVVAAQQGDKVQVPVQDPHSSRNATLTVTPCQVTRFSLKLALSGGEEVSSFRTERGFKTFLAPKAKEDLSEGAVVRGGTSQSAKVSDLTTAAVRISFADVVEDPACRRVVATELRFKKKIDVDGVADGSDEGAGGVWTVAKTMSAFRQLDEIVPGLDDLCSAYDIALELVGTPGTGGALVRLAGLEAPTKEEMAEAYETGFRWRMQRPRELRVVNRSEDSVAVTWRGPEYACMSGFIVRLLDSGGDVREVKMGAADEARTATFDGLAPCKNYTVEVAAYLQIDEGRRFESEFQSLPVATTAQRRGGSAPELSSLSVLKGRTYVTLSWLTSEWGACLGRLRALLCSHLEAQDPLEVTAANLNLSACLSPSSVADVGDRAAASFRNLKPCVQYQVSHILLLMVMKNFLVFRDNMQIIA